MSIFKDQVPRLLRTNWKSPNLLAEEIAAIFLSDVPLQIDSPLVLTQPPNGEPPIQIIMRPTDELGTPNTPVTINTGGGPTVPTPEFPVGTYTPVLVDAGTVPPVPGVNPPPVPPTAATGVTPGDGGIVIGSGGVFTGTVLSGTGSSYQVKLNTMETVTVQQLSIDPADTIPPTTPVIVYAIDNLYKMLVPVFLPVEP